MIKEVGINNFKSVQDLNLPLSRFNVLIGSNGSGKSNILEAIAFGAAASADKLDNEFLGSRGIRPSDAHLTKSAFSSSASQPILLRFKINGLEIPFTIEAEEGPILKWSVKEKILVEENITQLMTSIVEGDKDIDKGEFEDKDSEERFRKFIGGLRELIGNEDKARFMDIMKVVFEAPVNGMYKDLYYNDVLANFIIYSPESSFLRKLEDESQIKPLGVKGEGLFNLLRIFSESYGSETIEELKHYLNIIEWFDDFNTVFDQSTGRRNLIIKDRFIQDFSLNQSNVNEGFLFLLFYISLIISKETPSFFAIDNIDVSFHPKLCRELTSVLIQLCEKHNKQVIVTTHNPFILDGLNLNDSAQSLFVVRRNSEGETIADKVESQPQNIKLSDAWMRGYIGGHPETIA